MKYVRGQTTDHNIPWNTVDALYMPFNLGRDHWVLLCADFKLGHVIVTDSLVALTPDDELEKELRTVCTILPHLLLAGDYRKTNRELPPAPWYCRRRKAIPQQVDSGDCGIFAAKFFEYDVTGTDLSNFSQHDMNFCRRQYAVQLWSNTPIY